MNDALPTVYGLFSQFSQILVWPSSITLLHSSFFAVSTSHGRGAGLKRFLPSTASLSLLVRPMAHAMLKWLSFFPISVHAWPWYQLKGLMDWIDLRSQIHWQHIRKKICGASSYGISHVCCRSWQVDFQMDMIRQGKDGHHADALCYFQTIWSEDNQHTN